MHKRKKKHQGVMVFGLLCCMFCFFLISGIRVSAVQQTQEETDAQVVRVVLTNYDDTGFVVMDHNELSGYYMDYLNEIAKYTNWQYEVRAVSDDEELLNIVETGDYDLMVGIRYMEDAEKNYFNYPAVSMGVKHLVLATSKEHVEISTDNLSTLMGITVGTRDTAYSKQLREKFKSYCYANDLKYVEESDVPYDQGMNLIEVGDEERFEMLQDGRLDALITSDSMALANNLYVVATFGEMPFYAVSPKGDDHLTVQLEEAIQSIKNVDSTFEDRLYEKYFAPNFKREMTLSEEELEYLEIQRNLKVAVWDTCAPYMYLNDSGRWSGIAVEVFGEISEMTSGKISFEFVSCADSFAAREALEKGEADILGMTFTSVDAMERGDNRSCSYYTDYFSIYRNQNSVKSLEEAKIAVKKDMADNMLQSFGVKDTSGVIRVEDVVEALNAVNSGKADITFALQNVSDYYINYYQLNRITELDLVKSDISVCCLYNDSMDEILKNICNKCIANVDTEILERSITEYMLLDHKKLSLTDYIKTNRSGFTTVFIVLLFAAIAGLIIVVITISNKSQKIYEMLYRDDVTQDSSYLKFEEEVKQLISEQKVKEQYYIIFADISSFKYINDVFGYEVGNQVLCFVGKAMKEITNGFPTARMYADHFVGICLYEEKELLEKRLTGQLHEFSVKASEAFPDFNIFLKIGIYTWNTQREMEIRQLVNLANYASDNISNQSKSEFSFYTMELHDKILCRQEIEKDMHRAMEAGEFVAYFQPKYDVVKDEIIGAEALVRWKHSTKGLISPGIFVPIFEDNGFIIEVDFCIFEQVCRLLAERMKNGQKLYTISCNFSRRHFQRPEFVERLMGIVDKYQVQPEYIEIEITETVATDDFNMLIETVRELKSYGFKISIDDFGSGYSCIQLLYKLPIDVLKLDRVFVVEQDVNGTEEDINRSIVHICHNHNIRIICEGVETNQQKEFVLSYGCRYVQGFLYSRPVDRRTFLSMLG